MNDIIIFMLSKYTSQPCPKEVPLDFRSNPNIFAAESQLPELYLQSKQPRDKNISFYKITYSTKLKENIFPKQKYEIPSLSAPKVAKKIEKVNLDDLFRGVKLVTIDVFDKDFNLDNIEQSIIKNNIKKIIQENKIVPYESKSKIKSQWYLIGVRGYGPYTDEEIYNFLNKFMKDPKLKEMKDKFMIWERKGDIFYTVEVCYELLVKTFGEQKINEKQEDINSTKKDAKNDFESIILSLGSGGEQKTIPKREVNTRKYSKFNYATPIPNGNKMTDQVNRKGNRKMTYDYATINDKNGFINKIKNWNGNNKFYNFNYINNNYKFSQKNNYGNFNYNWFNNFGNKKQYEQNQNHRNNFKRYTINPVETDPKKISEEIYEEAEKEQPKNTTQNNTKKEVKIIDITDTLFS